MPKRCEKTGGESLWTGRGLQADLGSRITTAPLVETNKSKFSKPEWETLHRVENLLVQILISTKLTSQTARFVFLPQSLPLLRKMRVNGSTAVPHTVEIKRTDFGVSRWQRSFRKRGDLAVVLVTGVVGLGVTDPARLLHVGVLNCTTTTASQPSCNSWHAFPTTPCTRLTERTEMYVRHLDFV